jgi:SAM-dependent methyltransferase
MDTVTEWFDSIYGDPLYLHLYEHDDGALAAGEAEGVQRLVTPAGGARWLEACCGFGRHAERLAKAGFDVVGFDRSPMMLRRAAARAAAARLSVRYIRADIRKPPFAGGFDCASLLFDSFGFFRSDEEHLDAMLGLAAALDTHGRLIVELSNRERLLADLPSVEVEERHGCRIRKEHRFDLPRGRLLSTLEVEGAHGIRRWRLDRRLFTAAELALLSSRAGFDQVEFRGDWDGSRLERGSPRCILVARKAAFADMPALGD